MITKHQKYYRTHRNKLREYFRKYNLTHREDRRKRDQAYRFRHKEELRNKDRSRAVRKYGITRKQYDVLYERQHGMCKICRAKKKVLCVDHDHKTNIIRGLLCNSCNLLLGMAKDNVEILDSAIKYLGLEKGSTVENELEKPQAEQVC